MPWQPLPTGSFTGIDWSRPGATTGFDPHLVWAETNHFVNYGGNQPKWLPLLIELCEGCSIADFIAAASPDWLHVPPVYTSDAAPAGLRYCSARVKRPFFKHLHGRLAGVVQRFELGLTAGPDPDSPAPPTSVASGRKLRGRVFGAVDGGLAFANANFLRDGKARVKYFWRQDQKGVGPTPAAMAYGHELTGADINQAMAANTYNGLVDESLVYSGFKLPLLQKTVNHGTHVIDLACGPRRVLAQIAWPETPPSWAEADDEASRCDMVMVQLDLDTVIDSSGGSMNVHLLDGLMYILSCCENSSPVVANISWGTFAGPHDGTSVLEQAMDALVALRPTPLQITLPAGNTYQWRTHANVTLEKKVPATLHWCLQPDNLRQNLLELWLPPLPTGEGAAKHVRISVTPPGCKPLPALRLGESGQWTDGGGQPLCALIYPDKVATGLHGTCALLAVAPSFSFDREEPQGTTAPSGVWQITLTHTGAEPVTVDAYIQRNDEVLGLYNGARQSHLQDVFYDTSGNPGSFIDHPDNPSLIRRSGNFNSIASGSKTVSVGGKRIADDAWSRYSPRKPDPDASRPERPFVVKMPDDQAWSDETTALPGLHAAGTRSTAVVRLVGTSSAAPQVARKLLNALP